MKTCDNTQAGSELALDELKEEAFFNLRETLVLAIIALVLAFSEIISAPY